MTFYKILFISTCLLSSGIIQTGPDNSELIYRTSPNQTAKPLPTKSDIEAEREQLIRERYRQMGLVRHAESLKEKPLHKTSIARIPCTQVNCTVELCGYSICYCIVVSSLGLHWGTKNNPTARCFAPSTEKIA